MTFATFDRDSDGVVTEQEFNATRAERMAARATMGAPMPGAANAPKFADLDQNGDGQVTADEFDAFHQARLQGRGGMGPGAGQGMGPGMGMGQGGGRGAGRGMGSHMPTFADFDLNGDGSLTAQEFYQARANRIAERSQQGYPMRNLGNAPDFSAIDLDGNGQVDPREFLTAQTQHRQQMMQGPTAPQAQPQNR
ncbi:hypothetical protein CKO23_16395 [Thiocystis violacea]|nr:hypothetical protein [Thiocystis violacea]